MESKSIENNGVSATGGAGDDIEPKIEKKDVNNDTEAGFPAFRFPSGFEQQIGMLSSMMQQNHGLFDQLIGKQNQSKRDTNNNDSTSSADKGSTKSNDPFSSPDMAGKMFEQSMGMINSMFRDGQGGADMFGKFFGQRSPASAAATADDQPVPNVYPKLDDMDDTKQRQQQQPPQSKGHQQGQIDIEQLLAQGINSLGLKINDRNAGDLLGQLLGQTKKQQQQPSQPTSESEARHFYPKLDDLDIDNKPKQQPRPSSPPRSSSNQPTSPINLDNVINQGIDVIGTALKGNAGSIFGSLLKNSISTKNNSSQHSYNVPEQPRSSSQTIPEQPKSNQPFKQVDVEFPDDVCSGSTNPIPSAPPSRQMPEPIKPSSEPIRKKLEPEEEVEEENDEKSKTKKDSEKILDFIPDDAFEAAFDAMAFGKK